MGAALLEENGTEMSRDERRFVRNQCPSIADNFLRSLQVW